MKSEHPNNLTDKLYSGNILSRTGKYLRRAGLAALLTATVCIGYVGCEKEPEEEKTYPFLNAAGDWETKSGTIWDAEKHSMGSNKIPPLKANGEFKSTRKRTAAVESKPEPATGGVPSAPGESGVPEAGGVPSAPEAGGVPSAPEASGAPTAPTAVEGELVDEALDDELASIVKNWG